MNTILQSVLLMIYTTGKNAIAEKWIYLLMKNIITKVIPIHTGSAVIAEYPTKKNLMSGF